jgi:hypothetical protein
MKDVVQQAGDIFPFNDDRRAILYWLLSCCPKKLLEYIDRECETRQQCLDNGEIPDFKDLQRLSKSSIEIYDVLKKMI